MSVETYIEPETKTHEVFQAFICRHLSMSFLQEFNKAAEALCTSKGWISEPRAFDPDECGKKSPGCLSYAGDEKQNTFRMLTGHHPRCSNAFTGTDWLDTSVFIERLHDMAEEICRRSGWLEPKNVTMQRKTILDLQQSIGKIGEELGLPAGSRSSRHSISKIREIRAACHMASDAEPVDPVERIKGLQGALDTAIIKQSNAEAWISDVSDGLGISCDATQEQAMHVIRMVKEAIETQIEQVSIEADVERAAKDLANLDLEKYHKEALTAKAMLGLEPHNGCDSIKEAIEELRAGSDLWQRHIKEQATLMEPVIIEAEELLSQEQFIQESFGGIDDPIDAPELELDHTEAFMAGLSPESQTEQDWIEAARAQIKRHGFQPASNDDLDGYDAGTLYICQGCGAKADALTVKVCVYCMRQICGSCKNMLRGQRPCCGFGSAEKKQ